MIRVLQLTPPPHALTASLRRLDRRVSRVLPIRDRGEALGKQSPLFQDIRIRFLRFLVQITENPLEFRKMFRSSLKFLMRIEGDGVV